MTIVSCFFDQNSDYDIEELGDHLFFLIRKVKQILSAYSIFQEHVAMEYGVIGQCPPSYPEVSGYVLVSV